MSLLQHPCEAVIGPVYPWLTNVINAAQVRGLNREDLVNRPIDHFCYRCRTKDEYVDVRGRLTSDDIGELVVESMIGGRPISTVRLVQPYLFDHWSIPAVELTCPKPGKQHKHGLEHIEIVLGEAGASFTNSKPILMEFKQLYPSLEFDMKAYEKDINADISLELGDEIGSIKFHARPLLEVCEYEKLHGMVTAVPSEYFS